MAKDLHVGMKCWVGWCPDHKVTSAEVGPRFHSGVIVGGPMHPGCLVRDTATGRIHQVGGTEPMWNIDLDSGSSCAARESVIIPRDDGDPQSVDRAHERPAETPA